MQKEEIVKILKKLNLKYKDEGFIIVGIFGSYARDSQTKFSDIDIAYKLDYNIFSKKYRDGFSKLLRIEDIKRELQAVFKRPVDLVPNENKSIMKDLINV